MGRSTGLQTPFVPTFLSSSNDPLDLYADKPLLHHDVDPLTDSIALPAAFKFVSSHFFVN